MKTILATGLFCALAGAAAAAPKFYVDADATGSNDGSSWADAYVELSDALAAGPPAEIWVAEGTYLPSPLADPAVSFELVNGIELYGGFAGGETLREQRDWHAHPTILSGDYGTLTSAYHIVNMSGAGSGIVLDGFTVSGASATSYPDHINGGGIYNDGPSPTLRNLVVEDNVAMRFGAGIYAFSGEFTMVDCTIQDNIGTGKTGSPSFSAGVSGLFSYADFDLTRVTFARNTRGGLFANAGVIDDCDFLENQGNGATLNSTSTIRNSRFLDNELDGISTRGTVENCIAEGNGSAGFNLNVFELRNSVARGNANHGVYGRGATYLIANCLVEGNSTSNSGAGIRLTSSSDGVIEHCIVRRNVAALDGGGIYISSTNSATIRSTLVAENESQSTGGGIYTSSGTVTLLNVTVVNNVGGSLRAGGVLLVQNSVIWGHFPTAPSGTPTFSNSLVQGSGGSANWSGLFGVDGGGNLDVDPQFIDSGGSVEEIWVAEGVYAVSGGDDRDLSHDLIDGIAMYGGFAGDESILDERDWAAHPTVLSGEIGAAAAADNSKHVLTGTSLGTDTIVDGFTIRGGYGTASGAGVSLLLSSPAFRHCIFEQNASAGTGAAVFVIAGNPSFVDCSFIANQSWSGSGAALALANASATLASCSLVGNFAFSSGGAISAQGAGNLTLVNSIVYGNLGLGSPSMTLLAGATASVSSSLVEGCGGSGADWQPGFGSDGGGNLDADPRFLNQAAYDLRLAADSPAIDAGDETDPHLTSYDLAHMPRVQGSTIDLGAYEAGPVVATPRAAGRLLLGAATPNPFNPRTTIHFEIPEAGQEIRLELFDARGRLVRTLVSGRRAGPQTVVWDGRDEAGSEVASGLYLLLLRGESQRLSRKLVLVR